MSGKLFRTLALSLLLVVSFSANAITLVAASSSQSATVPVPAGTVAGDVMVAVIVNQAGGGITAPAGWTLIRSDGDTNLTQALFYRVATSGEPASYTWALACNRCVGGMVTYRGVDNGDPVEAATSAGVVNNAATIVAPSIATTVSGDQLIGFFASSGAKAGIASPAGMATQISQSTNGGQNGVSQLVADQALGAPGSTGTRTATAAQATATVVGQLIALRPSALDHFIITLPDGSPLPQQVAGQSFNIRIRAVDAGGATVASFGGSVDLTSTGILGAGGGTTATFTDGVLNNYAVTITNTGTFTLTATQNGGTKNGVSNAFAVVAGPFAKLQVLVQGETAAPGTPSGKTGVPVSPDAGASMTITVNAVDANWNVIQTITDSITLSSSDGAASLPASAALVNGTRTFSVALNTSGTQTVSASDTSNDAIPTGTSSPITVVAVAAGFNAFETTTPAGATAGALTTKIAGQAFNVDIVAIKNGAVDTNYNHTVTVTLMATNSPTPVPSGCPTGWTALQQQAISFPHIGRVTATFTESNAWRQARFLMTDGKTTSCSTNTFAIRPASLGQVLVQDATRTTAGTLNPLGATTAGGTPIHNAGRPFRVSVTGFNAAGVITSNYNGSPEPTALALILPTAADCASCMPGTFTTGTWSGAGGTMVTTTATYSEAGSFSMQLVDRHFADIDSNDSTTAQRYVYSSTFNVGRFVPDHFAVTRNAPDFSTGCAAGRFTYTGKAFAFAAAPVITITAQNAADVTTKNYTGSLFRLTDTSLTGRSYSDASAPAAAALDTAGLPPTTSDPAIVDNGNGTGTLTFSAGAGLDYVHAVPVAPFNALIDLSINVQDLDGVTVDSIDGATAANPVVFSAIPFDNGNQMRYGRVFVNTAVGSELLPLPVEMVAQYYKDTDTGFITNSADNCTTLTMPTTFAVREGATVTGSTTPAFTAAAAGDFGLVLSAPGDGHNGSADLTATVPSWLQFDWNGDGAYSDNPTSRATFGLYQGNPHRVYQREVVGPAP